VSASNVTAFQRARLAAAQPLSAARMPTIPVTVTPALIQALAAALDATRHDLSAACRLELQALHLQASLVAFRQGMQS